MQGCAEPFTRGASNGIRRARGVATPIEGNAQPRSHSAPTHSHARTTQRASCRLRRGLPDRQAAARLRLAARPANAHAALTSTKNRSFQFLWPPAAPPSFLSVPVLRTSPLLRGSIGSAGRGGAAAALGRPPGCETAARRRSSAMSDRTGRAPCGTLAHFTPSSGNETRSPADSRRGRPGSRYDGHTTEPEQR